MATREISEQQSPSPTPTKIPTVEQIGTQRYKFLESIVLIEEKNERVAAIHNM